MKQHIVILCGPDMTGKTQISKALAKVLGIPYFKASTERDTYLHNKDKFIMDLRYADPRLADFLAQTNYSVVMDRAWPCEFAYSKVFKRQTDVRALREADDRMSIMGAKVVVCRRTSYEGIVDDIDPELKEAQLKKLDEAYADFQRWTKCKTLTLFVDDENLSREVNDIVEWLKLF
jgi:hypothetical protein